MWIILNDNDLLLHDVATGILLQHSPQHWDLVSGSFSGNEPSKMHRLRTKFSSATFCKFYECRKARYSQIVTTGRLVYIHLKTCMTVLITTFYLEDLLENYFLNTSWYSLHEVALKTNFFLARASGGFAHKETQWRIPTLQLHIAGAARFENIQRDEVHKLHAALLHACCVGSATSFT